MQGWEAYRAQSHNEELQQAEGLGAKDEDEQDICCRDEHTAPDGNMEKQVERDCGADDLSQVCGSDCNLGNEPQDIHDLHITCVWPSCLALLLRADKHLKVFGATFGW